MKKFIISIPEIIAYNYIHTSFLESCRITTPQSSGSSGSGGGGFGGVNGFWGGGVGDR